jgi:hypothetical protein
MSSFSEDIIEAVWKKGRAIDGKDPDVYRLDAAGAIIKKDNRRVNTQFGWEIDHIFPKAKLKDAGVSEDKWDDLINLQPLHADNNRAKGDDYPGFTTEKVMNNETFKNITAVKSWKITEAFQEKIKKHYNL